MFRICVHVQDIDWACEACEGICFEYVFMFRILTGRVKRVKEWINFQLSFPVLFVVHGRLLAAVQSIGSTR